MAKNQRKEPPRFDEREDLKKQVRSLFDYVFQLRQDLAYTLRNIGRENINPLELSRHEERLKTLEDGLKTLTEGTGEA